MLGLKKHHTSLNHSWLEQLDIASPQKRIVKKNGVTESYARSKLATSIHNACMDATGYIGEAELTAENVCKDVENWLEKKYEVTSQDIIRIATKSLRQYNPKAAYEYAPNQQSQITEDDYGFVRL